MDSKQIPKNLNNCSINYDIEHKVYFLEIFNKEKLNKALS